MKLQLQIYKHEIEVTCDIDVSQGSYAFALCHTFTLSNIRNNEQDITPDQIENCEMMFRPAMKKYTFCSLSQGTLHFTYRGSLDGYFLFMQESIIHFSMYNGWYPIGFDVIEEYDLTLYCDDAYELINGIYDEEKHCWSYTIKHQEILDCNVMLVHKHNVNCLSNDVVKLYDIDHRYPSYIQPFFDHYTSVAYFYRELYGHDQLPQTTIVILPEKYQLGAYKRDQLIVFTELERDIQEEQHHLAHEMAHAYANGADLNSWEDWLNETIAEWSALLYEEQHDPEFFHTLMNTRKEAYDKSYVLNPNGLKRPDDVHETGTLILYELYEAYGRECIRTILQAFNSLAHKDTASLCQALDQEHHHAWIKHIQSHII